MTRIANHAVNVENRHRHQRQRQRQRPRQRNVPGGGIYCYWFFVAFSATLFWIAGLSRISTEAIRMPLEAILNGWVWFFSNESRWFAP